MNVGGKRVLVTGGSGFLGSQLCRSLARDAGEVHAVSRKPRVSNDGVRWWQGDLTDSSATQRLLCEIGPEVIFHLTTHGWGAPGLEHVLPTLHSDLVATVNLLAAAAVLPVRRIVVTGSAEEPWADGEVCASSPYAVAKWACGAYARMFNRLYHTPVVIARIFMTYGPGQPRQKLIPYTTLSLLNKQTPKISDGHRLVDWIYVDDVIRGLLATAAADQVEGCTLELGSGTLVSVREIVEQVAGMVGGEVRPVFGALPARPIEHIRAAQVSATAEKIGWRPTVSLTQGLQSTVDWYRSQYLNGRCAPLLQAI